MKHHKYIHRELEDALKKAVRQFPAVVITGPRQSGKSTLLKTLFSKTHAYLSFDDPAVRERAITDPRLFLETAGDKIILDEIQYVPGILSYVKILIDEHREKRGRFIFTGSQQFPLIKNLSDSLAGRIAVLELLPFSVSEKKVGYKKKKKFSSTMDYFFDACLRGSFPELTVYQNLNAHQWYSAYFQTYLERDIRSLYNIGDLTDFQRFFQLLAGRCGQILNMSGLANELGVAVNTIKRWISILEASRIIYLLPPYYRNFGKRMIKSPKLYFLDNGLICYLLSLKEKAHIAQGPWAGPLFENFCIQEMIKTLFHNAKSDRLYYLRTQSGLEIDIVLEKDGKLFPLECKFTKTIKKKMGESIEHFRRLFPKLSLQEGGILSLRDENFPVSRNVSVRRFDDYLSWLTARRPRT